MKKLQLLSIVFFMSLVFTFAQAAIQGGLKREISKSQEIALMQDKIKTLAKNISDEKNVLHLQNTIILCFDKMIEAKLSLPVLLDFIIQAMRIMNDRSVLRVTVENRALPYLFKFLESEINAIRKEINDLESILKVNGQDNIAVIEKCDDLLNTLRLIFSKFEFEDLKNLIERVSKLRVEAARINPK